MGARSGFLCFSGGNNGFFPALPGGKIGFLDFSLTGGTTGRFNSLPAGRGFFIFSFVGSSKVGGNNGLFALSFPGFGGGVTSECDRFTGTSGRFKLVTGPSALGFSAVGGNDGLFALSISGFGGGVTSECDRFTGTSGRFKGVTRLSAPGLTIGFPDGTSECGRSPGTSGLLSGTTGFWFSGPFGSKEPLLCATALISWVLALFSSLCLSGTGKLRKFGLLFLGTGLGLDCSSLADVPADTGLPGLGAGMGDGGLPLGDLGLSCSAEEGRCCLGTGNGDLCLMSEGSGLSTFISIFGTLGSGFGCLACA